MGAAAREARQEPWRWLPLIVPIVLVAVAVTGFTVTRRVVDDQEQRLLAERAGEAGALLGNTIDIVESTLQLLGPIGLSPDPAASGLFEHTASELVGGSTQTVGVAVDDGGGYTVQAAVGNGPAKGDALADDRAALASRALAEGEMVAALVTDGAVTRLVFALPVEGAPAVTYQELLIVPTLPLPSSPGSPFGELRGALYASPDPDPAQLVLTTEAEVPLSGRVERVPFSVGADRWLLVVGARRPLVGSFAKNVPWFFLGGGLLTAALATAVTATVTRRRRYALALVDERTTELQDAVGELRATQAFLDRLLRALPVLVIRISATEQRLTYVSPNVEPLFGISEADALAPDFLAEHICPDDLALTQAALGRIVADATLETVEYRFRHGDGAYRWLSMVGVPEIDETGRVTGIFGYGLDIDDRRQAEQAQRKAQEEAEAANRAKSDFMSRMSHELRTPLNAVLGFGQLLELDTLTDQQTEAVAQILKGGRHLLDLINEVLDVSRIEAGDLALSPEAVLVGELVRETVDLIRPLADERGINLVVDHSDALGSYVFADRQRAKQILLNLLSNAVKYNRPRGTVAVSCDQPADTRLRINVTDTGPGIPAERLGLLFTPFERLGAEHTAEEGTGIGLSLSQRLAEAMGGTLEVASALGQGSTFSVDLPRVEGPVERYERLNGGNHPADAVPAAHRKVVLYIEDNLSNLKLVERILAQRADVEVVAAMQGRLGLELAREHRPVLVLLDLHLPDMGGDQVLHRLRDDPATAAIPVVIVSADATQGQVQRLLTAGATAYMTKPIDVRELLRLLDETLNER